MAAIAVMLCSVTLMTGCSSSTGPVHRSSASPTGHATPTTFVPPDAQLSQDLEFSGSETGTMRSGNVRPVCVRLGRVGTEPDEWETGIGGLVLGGDDIPWHLNIYINPFVGAGSYGLGVDTPARLRLFPSAPNAEYFDAVDGELQIDKGGLSGQIDAEFVSDGPPPADGSARSANIHVKGRFICGDDPKA
jgi:hypothetical protein